jgi:uncharacterized damage-inducible protein DinB
MASVLADRFRRWFDYERDSHAKVLASLHTVPEGARSAAAFEKAKTLLAHILAARQMWLFRFGLAPDAPREFFPKGVSLDELAARAHEVESAWSTYLARLDDKELARAFEYKSLDAGWFRSTVEDILAQLFGHSWYHRGQIAPLVASLGGQPAITDFVYWTREPIPGPGARDTP